MMLNLLLLASLALPVTAHAPDAPGAPATPGGAHRALPQDDTPPEVEPEDEGPERLEAWPEVDRDLAKRISSELGRVRKAGTPEMAEGGRDELVAIGHAAAPELLRILGKERKEDARERIIEVLVAITDARHTRLLAAEFEAKSEPVRLFALERASSFPDPGIAKPAAAAFAAAQERAGTKKEVKHELYFAALAVCSSGSLDGLDVLHARALKDWGDCGRQIRAAIEALRGPAATERVAALMTEGDRKATVAALRLLAGCGDLETAKGLVRPLLDSPDNSIRVAAINAARGIVDGDPPLERLPVFEAVELANTWKARL